MKYPSEQIVDLHEMSYSYGEIAALLHITRNAVAGKIWRWKNPGMYKKGVSQGRNK